MERTVVCLNITLWLGERMKNKEIHEIQIEKLGVDICNIREGTWNYDEEFVNSVKNTGILQPILVRPVSDNMYNKEFGVVCGSRRYHAADSEC